MTGRPATGREKQCPDGSMPPGLRDCAAKRGAATRPSYAAQRVRDRDLTKLSHSNLVTDFRHQSRISPPASRVDGRRFATTRASVTDTPLQAGLAPAFFLRGSHGGRDIKLHATRLMRSGEVVLWREGAMVWTGAVGAHLRGIAFDTVSLHVDDSVLMAALGVRCTPGRCLHLRSPGFCPIDSANPAGIDKLTRSL